MCAASSTITSSETSRCRLSIANRGHRGPAVNRTDPRIPEHDADRQQHERHRTRGPGEIPVGARSGDGEDPAHANAAVGRRVKRQVLALRRPAGEVPDPALGVDQPARQAERLEPRRSAVTADDRRRARDVRVETRRGGDARGAPTRFDRSPGGRIDQVVGVARRRSSTAGRSCSRWRVRRNAPRSTDRGRRSPRGGRR